MYECNAQESETSGRYHGERQARQMSSTCCTSDHVLLLSRRATLLHLDPVRLCNSCHATGMLRHAPVDAVSYFCYRVSRTEEPRTGHWVSVVNICRWIRETTVHLGGEERSSRTLGCAGCRWVDRASAIDTSDRRSRCIPDLFGGSAVDHLAESGAR